MSGCLNASTGANTVGNLNPIILSGKSPMKPLVIRPNMTAHKPDHIKIHPKAFIVLLILPIPLNKTTPIADTTNP